MQDTPQPTDRIAEELKALRGQVERLNGQRFFRLEASLWAVAFWSLVRGLSFGLGSVLGATFLVAVLVRVLGSFDFIPILGDWTQRIIEEIQTGK